MCVLYLIKQKCLHAGGAMRRSQGITYVSTISSSGDHESLYIILHQSILQLLRYASLDKSGGPIADIAILRSKALARLKRVFVEKTSLYFPM